MANTGSSINNGKQQVSIYPYQQLSSSYGNELFYGFLNPGIYSTKVSIANSGDNSGILIYIAAGTTLVFQRQATDPVNNTQNVNFIGKIVLSDVATIGPIPKTGISGIWSSGAGLASTALYVIADWTYNLLNPNVIYVNFYIDTDTNIISDVKTYDGTFTHKLVVATLMNHQAYAGGDHAGNGHANDMSYYHVAYDFQPNRDVLKNIFGVGNEYEIDFDPSGRGVYVGAGNSLTGESIIFRDPEFNSTLSYTDTTFPWNLADGQGMSYPDRVSDTTGIIRPAVGLTQYYSSSSYQTNSPIDITGYEANYYQIDFLRIKLNEVDHTIFLGWESFLQPAASPELDFTNYHQTPIDNTAMISSNLMNYISQFNFPLSGEGETLLIAIRPRGGANGIPLTDGSLNLLFPESCIIPRKNSLRDLGGVSRHKRLKLPVWNSSDIGIY